MRLAGRNVAEATNHLRLIYRAFHAFTAPVQHLRVDLAVRALLHRPGALRSARDRSQPGLPVQTRVKPRGEAEVRGSLVDGRYYPVATGTYRLRWSMIATNLLCLPAGKART